MEPAIMVAIGALIISFFSLIGTTINSVFTAKTYKKNRRLEFLQRRDHLSQKISELIGRNAEAQMFSARFELVAVKSAWLPLQGKQAEQNMALIASIRKSREDVNKIIKLWDERIERIRLIYSNLTLETNAHEVETLIAIVQDASDDLKKANDVYHSTLHILETTNKLIKTGFAETDEKIKQINLDADEKKRQINLDFERAIEKLNKDYERTIEKSNK